MFASHSDRRVPDHNRNLQKSDLRKYVALKACLNGGRGCRSPKCNNYPKCNKVLNVITVGPKCNKALNVITFGPKCNKAPMQSFNCANIEM